MDCTTQRRHNPVDSICRKLQTIQRRGGEANSPFQIPKFCSSSYDSPQSGLRCNLEAILNKRAVRGEGEGEGSVMLTPKVSPRPLRSIPCPPLCPSTPSTPACSILTPANATYTITSTLAEWRGTGTGMGMGQSQTRGWQRTCSTPAPQTRDTFLGVSRGPQFTQPERRGSDGDRQGSQSTSCTRTQTPAHGLLSYNLNFCSSDSSSLLECELPYPALVVKRLSMGEGTLFSSEARKDTLAEVSLICEEDLLDTIFHTCDTQRRGKVYVSRIVDYLRHTTSRTSEDSGLEELCNMLDPEHKDVSIDLDTYHAIMKEWIEDCRNNGDDTAEEDLTQESVKLRDNLSAKRSMLLNMTSGSLEAFGGEASRGDLETSDLVYCVADLQFSNQKLQEDVRKLKQSMETMEDTNQRLLEENEELRNQAKLGQQLAQKEKMLKEEVEEMKMSLTCTEEGRARASAHSKHMERENQGLIANIASLQEENIKVTMELDELQKRMMELCDINADLQVQIHSFDAVMNEKDSVILERNRQVKELRGAVVEYSAVTELLRADKTKLENQMHMMQPDMAAVGLSLSVAYRLNQTSSGSLQTELALAQNPLESVERLSSNMSFASPLDETLDREVLLLMQGPTPDQMSMEFKSLISKLKRDFKEESLSVLSTLRGLIHEHGGSEASRDPQLQTVQAELDQRRTDWALSLEQLDQYTGSLEKELIKMASNMRRSRTEILHLSVRVQEQENQKQQLHEELDQLKIPQDSREASCQTPDGNEDQEAGEDLDWDEEFILQDFLRSEVEQKYRDFRGQEGGRVDRRPEEDRRTERGDGEEGSRWTVLGGEGQEPGGPLPLSPLSQGSHPQQDTEGKEQGTDDSTDTDPRVSSQAPQEAKLPECSGLTNAHRQAVTSDPSHTTLSDAVTPDPIEPPPGGSPGRNSPEQDRTITPGNSPPRLGEMVSPSCTSPVMDETISLTGSSHQTDTTVGGGGQNDTTAANMSDAQSVSQEQLAERAVAEDSTSLLPVLEEEEEGLQEPTQVPTIEVDMTGTDRQKGEGTTTPSDRGSPQIMNGGTTTEGLTPDPSLTDESPSALLGASGARKDSLTPRTKFRRELELSRSMEVIEEQKVQEDLSVTRAATEKEAETSVISEDTNGSTNGEKNSLSASDKEIETEFHRLSLGFKCDMFTLEKRLRLEERSRDLAEENVRREVSSCQGLLQALTPLCEDDNQSMEIIQRLQKNLDILLQSMTRVSSRSEMLGAIHQESRIGKAVEVMIQHVENLRRMYTKEHTELTELKETMMQSERSFGSHSATDDFRGKKQSGSQYYKSSTRRVSLAVIPRSGGGNLAFDMPKAHDATETEAERLTRRSPWNVTGKSPGRPPLKRFVSSGAWVETDEPTLMMKGFGYDTDSHSEEERREEPDRRRSSLTELGIKLSSLIMPLKTPNPSPSTILTEQAAGPYLGYSRPAASAASRGVWLWLALVVVLAALLALLASLVMQPVVDAAPVGTGDSWVTIQQLLWPYTGLRHNGQPPV